MSDILIYHNTRCSKSREALCILEEQHADVEVVQYLHNTPTKEELKALLKKLGLKAEELVRKKEPLYKEKYADKKMTEARWIQAMVKNPILIERPIVVKGDKAIIARPPERVKELL